MRVPHTETELEAALADLRWLLTSPNILDPTWAAHERIPLSQPWGRAEATALCNDIADDPHKHRELLEKLNHRGHGQRLGRRAEVLLGFAYAQTGELRHAGLILYGSNDGVDTKHGPGRQTLGELDFILRRGPQERCHHEELTVKVFLYDPALAPTDRQAGWRAQYAAFVGPKRRDTLAKKLARLVDHQLPLASRPECSRHLRAQGLHLAASSLRMPGHIFYPADLSGETLPLPLAPETTEAKLRWWRQSAFLPELAERLRTGEISRVTPLPQHHWMGPRTAAPQPAATQLPEQLQQLESPQMLLIYPSSPHGPDPGPERCFVVPDDWGRPTS